MQDELDTAPPAKPVESPQVSENRTTELPQPAPQPDAKTEKTEEPKQEGLSRNTKPAKKSAAKKRASKKTAPKKAAPRKAAAKKVDDKPTAADVAKTLLDEPRKWGTGRD